MSTANKKHSVEGLLEQLVFTTIVRDKFVPYM